MTCQEVSPVCHLGFLWHVFRSLTVPVRLIRRRVRYQRSEVAIMSVPDNAREFYTGKNICAPMVRISTLATRLVAHEYGAHLVYSEELVDKRFAHCTRVVNKELNSIDFIDAKGMLMFRTIPEEKERVVFQVGTSSAAMGVVSSGLVAIRMAALVGEVGTARPYSKEGGSGAW